MNAIPKPGRVLAVLACAGSLAATTAFLAPTAASAKAATSCANKNLSIQAGTEPVMHIAVKAVTVEGTSCAEAYKLITDQLDDKLPSGWKSGIGNFKAPEGLIPSELKKGSKRITFAIRGG